MMRSVLGWLATSLTSPCNWETKTVNIRLIPYYAWGNRGKGEMTVWMPLAR